MTRQEHRTAISHLTNRLIDPTLNMPQRQELQWELERLQRAWELPRGYDQESTKYGGKPSG